MDRRRVARVVVIGVGAALLAACGDDDATSLPSLVDVPETVAMGVMPQQLSDAATLPPPPPAPTTQPIVTTTSTLPPPFAEPIEAPIGDLVDGRRILLIGDSVLASAAPQNGGQLCDALVLFGWEAEIDAVADRGIDLAGDVLDARLGDGQAPHDWNAVGLSFGSDVDGHDPTAVDEFGTALDAVIERVSPRPVLLYTLAGAGSGTAAVNDLIRAEPQSHHNVLVVEFADAGADGVPVVDSTGRALTDDGMKRFAIRTAAAVGDAPGDGSGICLPSQYGG